MVFSAINDEQRIKVFEETTKALPTALTESPKYWAEDISFFIDQLNRINSEDEIFKQKLDLDRIGVFGMSLGGIASCEVSLSDERIKACINIDGGLYGSILKSEFNVPIMFLNSKRYLGYGNLFTSKSNMDSYSLSVVNSDHYNFSDYTIYPTPTVKPLLGSIDGKKVATIMNVMVLSFFDKYLKEKQNIDLIQQAKIFSEIEIISSLE